MPAIELWTRPWALVETSRKHRFAMVPGAFELPAENLTATWIYTTTSNPLRVDRSQATLEPVPGYVGEATGPRTLGLVPVPLRRQAGVQIEGPDGIISVSLPHFPERPSEVEVIRTADQEIAHHLFLRLKSVWARLKDAEAASADPSTLWVELRRRWTEETVQDDAFMDVIVRHARNLGTTIDTIEKSPRRILRRYHQMTPLSRVQEVDRRSMTWLIRQPGESLAERAGDRQQILAVARRENFDTLENRVVRAYAAIARSNAKDYKERNSQAQLHRRFQDVSAFEKRCKRLDRDFAELGVRTTDPGITPNFVMQHNPAYRKIWEAWQELIQQRRELDELWRWQSRSWEDYCALVLMVALQSLPGSKLIAASPLYFRDEQHRGSWLDQDNPFGVFYLPDHQTVFEVRFRMKRPHKFLADFGAPIWVRYGKLQDDRSFLKYIAVWPIWHALGGLCPGEADEISGLITLGRRAHLSGGVVMRPTAGNADSESEDAPATTALTVGTSGAPLRKAIGNLVQFFDEFLQSGPIT
ncbi:DUF2357 domain-containing protein [uncultured Roseibium sp.]|uniref:DUF2357 domain-containing protein n=1 Tax=uncultured Roseibium sp. TaxID=1936171 RepID=UPI00262D40D2|nr:DUF2357 domain-containing protein [uncultured Roseibium sp.]